MEGRPKAQPVLDVQSNFIPHLKQPDIREQNSLYRIISGFKDEPSSSSTDQGSFTRPSPSQGTNALFSSDSQSSIPDKGFPESSGDAVPHSRREGYSSGRRLSYGRTAFGDDTKVYLEELERKRRQLDEQIHRFIASKEREYKTFQKHLQGQHKVKFNGERIAVSSSPALSSSPSAQVAPARVGSPRLRPSKTVEGVGENGERSPNKASGKAVAVAEEDPTAPQYHEGELLGIVTPAWVPLLESKAGRRPATLERTSSAPLASSTEAYRNDERAEVKRSDKETVQRSASDPLVDRVPTKRPSRLQLEHRTSSSGSNASEGRSLTSALKSPKWRASHPGAERKRVSLAIGDMVVTPGAEVVKQDADVQKLPTERTATQPSQLAQHSGDSPQTTSATMAEDRVQAQTKEQEAQAVPISDDMSAGPFYRKEDSNEEIAARHPLMQPQQGAHTPALDYSPTPASAPLSAQVASSASADRATPATSRPISPTSTTTTTTSSNSSGWHAEEEFFPWEDTSLPPQQAHSPSLAPLSLSPQPVNRYESATPHAPTPMQGTMPNRLASSAGRASSSSFRTPKAVTGFARPSAREDPRSPPGEYADEGDTKVSSAELSPAASLGASYMQRNSLEMRMLREKQEKKKSGAASAAGAEATATTEEGGSGD
ncbi:hypothetical protein LTR66_000271 [Elasticomyces elasticus]|nr:hypothetical protein LTR66_000271 [Elasticomyces elasticus]